MGRIADPVLGTSRSNLIGIRADRPVLALRQRRVLAGAMGPRCCGPEIAGRTVADLRSRHDSADRPYSHPMYSAEFVYAGP